MSITPAELKPIAIEYLFEGMVLAEDIYSYNGKALLLAKGNTLTEHFMERLKEYNDQQRNILVFEATYHALIDRGLPAGSALAQGCLEERVGYVEIKEKANELLERISAAGSMSKDDTDSVSLQISEKLDTLAPSVIFQCLNTPRPIDEYLRQHSVNVGLLNGLIGKWIGMSNSDVDLLVLAGLVHDVGKMKIPAEIINAPRGLSLCEFEVMKTHPIYSYELLSTDKRFPEPVKLAARYHHEKMNGSGYPDGLIADKIPLFAKITSISDIYDAMISKRPYKKAYNPFSVISSLEKQQFSDLDIRIVSLFTRHMPEELVGKSVFLSDGSIGIVKFLVPNDLEYPIVDVDGEIKKTDRRLYCERLIFDT